MKQDFIFYDTETTGRNPNFDQVLQYAAVYTDSELTKVDELELRCRRLPQIIPQPAALLVNNLSPSSIDQAQYSSYEFACHIQKKLRQWGASVFSGYNIFSFDEKFMRGLFYQNLLPIYFSQTNGNSRLDILSLVRAAEVLFPYALKFPNSSSGRTSKKLEDIALVNGFKNHNAHDALGDVEATIYVANLIRMKIPLLWRRALMTTSRRDFRSVLAENEIFLVYDDNFGWPTMYPACFVGNVQGERNSLLLDLRHEPQSAVAASEKNRFKGKNRPFRVCREAEAPLIFALEDSHQMTLPELPSIQSIEARFLEFQRLNVSEEIIVSFESQQHEFPDTEYIEQKIYEDFASFDDEKWLMSQFHLADPTEKIRIANRFQDKRFSGFAKRIIFDNWPQTLSEKQAREYSEQIKNRINTESDVPWNTVKKGVAECDRLISERPDRTSDLLEIRHYLQSFSN